jgi:arylsulfatase A-like enzyme
LALWTFARILVLAGLVFCCSIIVQSVFATPPVCNPTASTAARTGQPNFVFILADDLESQPMPQFERLDALMTRQGVSFSQAIVTESLCCPSRASILRGQYPHNHLVRANTPPRGGFKVFYLQGRECSTIATWLQGSGYATGLFGKYLNTYPEPLDDRYVPPGWTDWHAIIGPYAAFDYTLNENGALVSYGHQEEQHFDDVLTRKSVEFIKESLQNGRPFFAYIAPFSPHEPAIPAPRHATAFPGVLAPRTPAVEEVDIADKPAWLRARAPVTAEEMREVDALYRRRLQSMLGVEDLVAQVVETVVAGNALDNTYIIFMSDNGFHLGERRIAYGKTSAYEENIRVPLIVRGPGVPAGVVRQHLVTNNDIAPTLAQLAGIEPPAFVDGRSLVPLLGVEPPPVQNWRQAVLVEHLDKIGELDIPGYSAIRTLNHTFVKYVTGDEELYSLEFDPYQLQSQHAEASGKLLRLLAERAAELASCLGAECRVIEDKPLPIDLPSDRSWPG